MKLPIYLDYAATTPIDNLVVEKMLPYLKQDGIFGNPASIHSFGQQAQKAIQEARSQVADLIHCQPEEIIWTSGATESINLAIKGVAHFYKEKGRHIITTQIEHKATLDTCKQLEREGFEVTYLVPEQHGIISNEKFIAALRPDTILVSMMHVNNETGVIQDIDSLGQKLREKNIYFHVDAAQSLGKLEINLQKLPADLLSISAHKIYGPKGIGALFIRRQPRVHLEAQLHGGQHQNGLRAGTLSTHQIVGMGEACAISKKEMAQEFKHVEKLRDQLWKELAPLGHIYLNSDLKNSVPHILNIGFDFVHGEALLARLKNLAVASGAACNSASIEPSYVLQKMGRSYDLANASIRISFGRFTQEEEIDFAGAEIKREINYLRELSPRYSEFGELDSSDPAVLTGVSGGAEKGEIVKLQAKIHKNIFATAQFKAQGSPETLAAASWLTEWLQNKSLAEANQLTPEMISTGLGLSRDKLCCSQLVLHALKELLKQGEKS